MRTLLSLLLSVTVLVSSSSPAFAQLVPAGRGVSTIARMGEGTTVALETANLLRRLGYSPALAAGRMQGPMTGNIRQFVTLQVEQQLSQQGGDIRPLMLAGRLEGLASRIINLRPSAALRNGLFRNEFVTLALSNQASAEQIQQALSFYREDLAKKAVSFSGISEQDPLLLLENAGSERKGLYLDALSDAAALGLLGSAEDVPALLNFYKKAAPTALQHVAATITARNLLRWKAYDAFNEWVKDVPTEGIFWRELDRYVKEENLPVTFEPAVGRPQMIAGKMSMWLASGCAVNGINAFDTQNATRQWVSLGQEPLVAPVEAEALQKAAEKVGLPMAEKPLDIADLAPVTITPVSLEASLAPLSGLPIEGIAVPTTLTGAELPVEQSVAPVAKNAALATREAVKTVETSTAGVFYSGLPVFHLIKAAKNLAQKVRGWFGGSKPVPVAVSAVREPAGLHENDVHSLYENITPPLPYDAEDAMGLESLPSMVPMAGEGFKFTVERSGEESILSNVNITISSSIKLANGYNRLVQTEDHVFELRNQTLDPKKMERFFFVLSTDNGALQTLIEGAQRIKAHYPLRVKIRFNGSENWATPFKRLYNKTKAVVQIPLYSEGLAEGFILADLDTALLPEELVKTADQGYLRAQGNKIWYMDANGRSVMLSQYYVRLPKEESSKWIQVFQNNPQVDFKLNVYSSLNKTNFMTYIVSPMRIGTGKAFGPIMSSLGLSPFFATGIPLFANNGLSIVLGPLMPFLRRIGDANMYRLGVALYALASTGALALGLNGFMGVENATSTQVGGLIGVLIAMGFGGVLINTTQNNLVASNVGAMPAVRSKKTKNISSASEEGPNAATLGFLGKRVKEIFSKGHVEMRDSVRYQWLSALKNVGTFGFLALPFGFNLLSEAVGSSVRADFSLSFWALAGLSLYSLFKIMRMPLKDSFPRDLTVLRKMLKDKEMQVLSDIEKQLALPEGERNFNEIVKQLNGILGPYARATSYKTREKKQDIAARAEAETLQNIQAELEASGLPAEQVKEAMNGLEKAFAALGKRSVGLWNVMKMKGVPTALGAMTLLTVHELGTSSEFAYQVEELAKANFGVREAEGAALGWFLTAFFLYGTSFFSRLAGNWLALRTSEGSMYAFSSAISAIGTSLLIAAEGSMPMLFTGAILATFGMGNFFSQVFEYTIKQAPKFRQELAVLIGYTMPIAAALTAGVHTLNEWGGAHAISVLGLKVCLGALFASFLVAPRMFADSSLVKAIQYYGKKFINLFKRGGGKNGGAVPPAGDLGEPAPAQ